MRAKDTHTATVEASGPGLERDVPLPEPDNNGTEPAARDERDPLLLRTLAQLLTDPDALRPPEAVVPRLAYRGRVGLLVGREKLSGKSTLLTAAEAAVTRDAEFLDGRCAGGSVLHVTADQEHAGDVIRRAVRFGAQADRFHVLWPRHGFADLVAALDRLDPFPVLVVVDTLANFVRVADPHSSGEWPNVLMPLVRVARDLPTAVVLSHHATKQADGGYRDSTAIGALVDYILELQPDPGNATRRTVKALGRWPMPNFVMDLLGDTYQLVAGGELSLDARVLLFVEQHPQCSKRTLRDGVGGRDADVDAAIRRLLDRGAVQNTGTANAHAYVPTRAPTTEREPGEEGTNELPF